MHIESLTLPEIKVLTPIIYKDARGYFFERFNEAVFRQQVADVRFVQDNHSHSIQHVLRGLHYQLRHPQGKLITVLAGEIFDVVVDIRKSSPRFGQWLGINLSEQNKRHLWAPAGFAHGFVVTSQTADVLYKTTDYWCCDCERALLWNDASLGIVWPIEGLPILSEKDRMACTLSQAEVFD